MAAPECNFICFLEKKKHKFRKKATRAVLNVLRQKTQESELLEERTGNKVNVSE